ncbi:MAG: RusA family crossover junction endodeoxyribonuclease [Planctomycetota bacterium]|nr:RusA family crossover junction endodeoxyribonuclease [Planctomycetota bacterium]
MRIVAWIECNPVGKGRPRFGRGRTYTPKATEQAERLQATLLLPYVPREPLEGPLSVRLAYTFAPPADPAARAEALAGRRWPARRGTFDVDNLAKLTMDVMTRQRWWIDDHQVVELRATKAYGERPGVRVEVLQIGG